MPLREVLVASGRYSSPPTGVRRAVLPDPIAQRSASRRSPSAHHRAPRLRGAPTPHDAPHHRLRRCRGSAYLHGDRNNNRPYSADNRSAGHIGAHDDTRPHSRNSSHGATDKGNTTTQRPSLPRSTNRPQRASWLCNVVFASCHPFTRPHHTV